MKKLIFGIILLFCVNSYAINGFSIYKMYTQYDTVTHLNLDSNLNRPASWSSLLVDTLDKKFMRFTDLKDSVLPYIKLDTIRSNPDIDSTRGNTVHTGNYTVTGTMTVDTLKSIKGINATDGTFSGALAGTTLNTGNGANELHPMDQGVRTTDDVTFDSTRTRVSVVDSIKLGTGSYLKNYVEGSFPCTLKTSDVTVQQIGTAYYTKVGNKVTISFPYLEGVSNSTTLRIYCTLPYLPRQQEGLYKENYSYATLRTSSLFVSGIVEITSYNGGEVYLFLNTGNFATTGPKGCHPFTTSYITE